MKFPGTRHTHTAYSIIESLDRGIHILTRADVFIFSEFLMTAAVGFDSFFARNVIQRSRPSGWRHGVLLVRFLIHAGIHGVSNLPSKTLSTRVLQCAFQKACFDDKDEWYGAGRDETVRCSADFWRSGLSRLLPGHLWRRGNTCMTRCVATWARSRHLRTMPIG